MFQKFPFYWAPFEQSMYSLNYKSREEKPFMKLKRDKKFGEESTYRSKIGIRKLTKSDLSTRKPQKFSFKWAPIEQSIYCLS